MTDIVTPLFQWLNANPELAGLATFIISAAESVAIIGTVVPGSITMTAIGTLAGAGVIPLWGTIFWAILGAIVGDGISYWLGHYFKDRIRNMWPFKHNPGILQKGENFVHKYGVMSVFIGRFVGPVRALVPVVAGMLGMKPLQFTVANVTSAIGWAPAYMLPGIMLGAASLELPPDIAMHVILAFFLGTLFIGLCCWLVYKILQLIHFQIDQMQSWFWNKLKQARSLSWTTVVLKHHDPEYQHGQLNAAIYAGWVLLGLVALCLLVKWQGAANLTANDAAFHLARGIRNDFASNIMIVFTLLGERTVIFPVILAMVAYALYLRRPRLAIHFALLMVLTSVGADFIKNAVKSPRPWGIVNQLTTFSMPSGHTTIATVFYFALAYFVATSLTTKRKLPYVLATLVVLAVSCSRIYLGAHWFTDVLGGWLLGTLVLLIVTISYERVKEKPVPVKGLLGVTFVALVLSFSYYSHKHFAELQVNHTLQSWPVLEISPDHWWEKNNDIPSFRSSLFGFPSQRINLEWAGNLDDIRNTLQQEGWGKPPARDWISTLHRIADIRSAQYLPLISPQYLDKKPALVITRMQDNASQLLVIRLWQANRVFQKTNTPLWVGYVGVVPRSYSWIRKRHPGEIEPEATLVFPLNKAADTWEWKALAVLQPNGKQGQHLQTILLIRAKATGKKHD